MTISGKCMGDLIEPSRDSEPLQTSRARCRRQERFVNDCLSGGTKQATLAIAVPDQRKTITLNLHAAMPWNVALD